MNKSKNFNINSRTTKILIIDNYDSFTYNIFQRLGEIGFVSTIKYSDKISIQNIKQINPTHIIISPGPCSPNESGNSINIINKFHKSIPILGICLGHQCIAQAFGGNVKNTKPVHGKPDTIINNKIGILKSLNKKFTAARYHSLIVENKSLPNCFEISATNNEGLIMGIKHKIYPLEGIQFHPESILTKEGYKIFSNFINHLQ